MAVGINKDGSYRVMLSTETKPLIGNDDDDLILELNTGDCYFWHEKDGVKQWLKLGEAVE